MSPHPPAARAGQLRGHLAAPAAAAAALCWPPPRRRRRRRRRHTGQVPPLIRVCPFPRPANATHPPTHTPSTLPRARSRASPHPRRLHARSPPRASGGIPRRTGPLPLRPPRPPPRPPDPARSAARGARPDETGPASTSAVSRPSPDPSQAERAGATNRGPAARGSDAFLGGGGGVRRQQTRRARRGLSGGRAPAASHWSNPLVTGQIRWLTSHWSNPLVRLVAGFLALCAGRSPPAQRPPCGYTRNSRARRLARGHAQRPAAESTREGASLATRRVSAAGPRGQGRGGPSAPYPPAPPSDLGMWCAHHKIRFFKFQGIDLVSCLMHRIKHEFFMHRHETAHDVDATQKSMRPSSLLHGPHPRTSPRRPVLRRSPRVWPRPPRVHAAAVGAGNSGH